MKKLFLLFIMLFVAGCSSISSADFEAGDYKTIAEANNRFGFDLLKLLEATEEHPNVFFSPISIHSALSMAFNGADGDTKKEMADVLHIKDFELEEINRAFLSLLSRTQEKDFGAELTIANSIWMRDGFPFKEEFVKNLEDYYLAVANERDFSDSKTADEINQWVKKQTKDKIEQIIDGNIDPDTIAFIINAIYFKGDWLHQFNEDLTFEQPFYTRKGDVVDHPFMRMNREFNYFENDVVQAVELPYENNELSMVVLLPKTNLDDLYADLSFEAWNTWKSQFSMKEGDLLLPKFKFEYEVSLNDALEKLGMNLAFTNQADFSRMAEDDRVYINEVKHKSYIDVNEKGTEAAAVTSVEMRVTSVNMDQFVMNVNQPFLFMIQDNESGMILFVGEINQPEIMED